MPQIQPTVNNLTPAANKRILSRFLVLVVWGLLVLGCRFMPNSILDFAYTLNSGIQLILPIVFVAACLLLRVRLEKALIIVILAGLTAFVVSGIFSFGFMDCASDVSPGVGITRACEGGAGTEQAVLISMVSTYSLFCLLALTRKPRAK